MKTIRTRIIPFTMAIVVAGFMALGISCGKTEESPKAANINGKKIAMVIGFIGYDTSELFDAKKMFEEKGAAVTVVSNQMGKAKSGTGVEADVEMLIDQINVTEFDAVVFVGGSAAGEYLEDAAAHQVARNCVTQGKILASICAGSSVLAKAGVLKGKTATGYHKAPIVEGGGTYSVDYVVRDGRIITAMGPMAVKEFTEKVIASLQ